MLEFVNDKSGWKDKLAFFLSSALSPYLVIPVFTIWVVFHYSEAPFDRFRWSTISIFFSTLIPLIYILIGVWQGKLTDIHVREREQRGGPFAVAILSTAIGSALLFALSAPVPIVVLGLLMTLNGIVCAFITCFWKISLHVSVLGVAALTVLLLVSTAHWWLFLLLPPLIWARIHRKRHNLWQGIAALMLAWAITVLVLWVFGLP